MASYHPSTALLTEYAAGTLAPAYISCITAHLHYCSHCRQLVAAQEQVASALLEDLTPLPLSDNSFASVMEKIDNGFGSSSASDLVSDVSDSKVNEGSHSGDSSASLAQADDESLPTVVKRLAQKNLGELDWEPVTKGIDIFRLKVGESENELSLYRIQPGRSIPPHTHKGDELMQLLQGSFSDKNGVYLAGDFVECNESVNHAPVAGGGEPCICIVALSAPLQFTGIFRRFVNPFLRIQPQ